jgi:hypothetical protein
VPIISLDFSKVKELTPERASFLSHSHWLRAFAVLGGFRHDAPTRLTHVLARLGVQALAFPVSGGATGDHADVHACLNRAWGTELVMCGTRQYANEEELLRLANSWAAVQAYYAAYGGTQALIVAEGHARPTTHAQTQRMGVDLWIARGAQLPPWTFAVGSKQDRRCANTGMANGPARPLTRVSALSGCTPENCWELAEQVLRTTREEAHAESRKRRVDALLRARQKEWTANHSGSHRASPAWWAQRPRLDAAEKAQVERSVRPYTLLDYLYRLRRKANYEDAKMYTDGPSDYQEAEGMNAELIRIAAMTLMVHEVRIARLIGPKRFLESAEAWVGRNAPNDARYGLPVRLPILRDLL